jgi:hypothetical protein
VVTVSRQKSIREYLWLWRYRYRRAGKAGKRWVLDEVAAVTGYHRKSAIRLLAGKKRRRTGRRRGRLQVYGREVARAARVLYEASGYISARRLQPFVPELMDRLAAFGELDLEPETNRLLRTASASTLDRLLAPVRLKMRRAPRATRPGALLKQHIPVRRAGEWDEARPGFLEIDTVAHCGDTAEGFHLWTLTAVDVYSGWVELEALWGRREEEVMAAIRKVRRRMPVPVLGIDCDNGSEFINHSLQEYCLQSGVVFTRAREHRKNDSAHVEQKNGAVVRKVAGYSRYSSQAAFEQLRALYSLVRLHTNFFQPVQKLRPQAQWGQHGRHDDARTPFQRLKEARALTGARLAVLEKLYCGLNPLDLNRRVYKGAARLLSLSSRTTAPLTADRRNTSVNGSGNQIYEAHATLR